MSDFAKRIRTRVSAVAVMVAAAAAAAAAAVGEPACQGPEWVPISDDGRPGLDDSVHAMVVFDDGSGSGPALYAGGFFTTADGMSAHHIARWDGDRWSPLGAGVSGAVDALAVFDDGLGDGPALYAGGLFATAGGAPASRIARWDGRTWSPVGDGVSGSVSALCVFDDGSGSGPALYAGGAFTTAGGVPALRIARWDGRDWSAVGGGMDVDVSCLSVFDDGSGSGPALYAGGAFTTAGGVSAHRIARWDGSGWSALGGGMIGSFDGVGALAVYDDGSGAGPALYAGGRFTAAGGVPANRIARWDGRGWSALGSGMNDTVLALITFDVGDGAGPALYAAGRFTSAGGVAASRVARWDGDAWSALGSGVPDRAFALTPFDDGSGSGPALYVGGWFTASPAGDAYLARWACPASPPPPLGDLTGDGLVGLDDLLTMLGSWGDCSDCGNCPPDLGGDCTVDFDDLLLLLQEWS